MKKICFVFIAFWALCSFCPVFAIEEDVKPSYGQGVDYSPIYPSDIVPSFFSKIKKDEIYTLDNYRETLKSSSANIDAVTREDIQKQSSPGITQLLNSLGSVTVQNSNGSDGSISSLRIRGTDRVRLTIDGIRTDRPSLTTPGVETQFMLSDDIETIEVLKGAQGNVSGVNATGGVVSMQTRRGEGAMKFEAGSEIGKYGTFKERFAVMGGEKSADYYLSTTWYKTNGAMRTKNMGRLFNDSYDNLSVVSNLGHRLFDDKAEIRDVFRFSNSKKGMGLGYSNLSYSYYNDPNNYVKNMDFSNSLSYSHAPNEAYDYNMRFGLFHNSNNNYTLPDVFAPDENSISKINSTRLNFITQHNFKFKDWNKLSVGYNLENENIDGKSSALMYGSWPMFPLQPYNSAYDGSTLQNDVYINDVINIKDIFYLRGGARFLSNNEYGAYITPNASAALVLPTFKLKTAKTKFRGSWGKSVNTPTLYQRYGGFRDSFMAWSGNSDLNAEKNTSYDAGVEQSFMDDKLKLEFGYFHSKYKDYISGYYEIDPVTWFTTGYYDNIDRASISGYEGKVSFEPNEKFKFLVNYTYTNSKDKTTGLSLPATPKNRFNGTIYFTPFERWNLYAGIETGSSRTMSSTSNNSVPGYVDARLGTSIKIVSADNLNVYLKGNIYNLFNQNISMYKNTFTNDEYYSPKIRLNTGLFLEFYPFGKDNGGRKKERV